MRLNVVKLLWLWGLGLLSSSAQAMLIVATIPPLAGMALPLLSQNDRVQVILSSGQSPHGFQMKPSHRLLLEQADVILAVGSGVDVWAEKALKSYPEKVVLMKNLPGLVKLAQREDANWPKHEHDDHDGDHDGVEAMSEHEEIHVDPHFWLSPLNGQIMAQAIAQKMMQVSPAEQAMITEKSLHWQQALRALDTQLADELSSIQHTPFIVLHDAYQYFEKHFHLFGVGAIQVNPELKPSLKKVLALRQKITEQGVVCVFKEPQFPEKQVAYLVKDMSVKIGTLDPIGIGALQSYDVLLENLTKGFIGCLTKQP